MATGLVIWRRVRGSVAKLVEKKKSVMIRRVEPRLAPAWRRMPEDVAMGSDSRSGGEGKATLEALMRERIRATPRVSKPARLEAVRARAARNLGAPVIPPARRWSRRVSPLPASGSCAARRSAAASRRPATSSFTFIPFPMSQWKALRTTNALERINSEFRQRTKIQASLPSEEGAFPGLRTPAQRSNHAAPPGRLARPSHRQHTTGGSVVAN